MEAIRVHQIVETDGEVKATGLPCRKGQRVEMIVLLEPEQEERPRGTARDLLNSELCGMWKDRHDIPDSPAYARELRERAQRRRS